MMMINSKSLHTIVSMELHLKKKREGLSPDLAFLCPGQPFCKGLWPTIPLD